MMGTQDETHGGAEVIDIDLVCESCGASNPPGSEFCSTCDSYLAWDRSAPPSGRPAATPPVATSPATSPWTPPAVHPDPSYAPGADYPTQVAATETWQAAPTTHAGPAHLTPDDSPTAYTGPAYTGPANADPGYANPGYADPAYADPGYTDPGYTDPAYGTSGDGQAGYPDFSCPHCGEVNPGTRRFCQRCGYAFYSSQPADVHAGGWSAAELAAHDREARRAYRRSLPPLYRWRRVLITVLVLAVLAAMAVVLRRDPVGVLKGTWYGLTRTYVTVTGIQAVVEPADAASPPTTPAALVDSSVEEFTMKWTPSAVSTCDAAPGTATIVLRFPPARVRQLQVVPGLDLSNPQRARQPLPKLLGVRFDGGPCTPVPLSNAPTQPAAKLDSGRPVTEMRIGIADAYPAGADAQPLISITELIVKAYPS